MEKMIEFLKIDNPAEIFFAKEVSCKDTESVEV
jgi:hypothetical protein